MGDLSDAIESSPKDHNDLDFDSDDVDEQIKKRYAERYKQDTIERKWLSQWAASVVSFWLILVMVVLFKNSRYFHLSDSVLITLLGTTTLNVLTLTVIVLKSLFGQDYPSLYFKKK